MARYLQNPVRVPQGRGFLWSTYQPSVGRINKRPKAQIRLVVCPTFSGNYTGGSQHDRSRFFGIMVKTSHRGVSAMLRSGPRRMRRDIRRRVFCPMISPAWRRRIGSGPLAAAVGRQREPLALVHEFRSGVVLDDLGAFDRCPATLRVGGVQISGPRSARTGGPPSSAENWN